MASSIPIATNNSFKHQPGLGSNPIVGYTFIAIGIIVALAGALALGKVIQPMNLVARPILLIGGLLITSIGISILLNKQKKQAPQNAQKTPSRPTSVIAAPPSESKIPRSSSTPVTATPPSKSAPSLNNLNSSTAVTPPSESKIPRSSSTPVTATPSVLATPPSESKTPRSSSTPVTATPPSKSALPPRSSTPVIATPSVIATPRPNSETPPRSSTPVITKNQQDFLIERIQELIKLNQKIINLSAKKAPEESANLTINELTVAAKKEITQQTRLLVNSKLDDSTLDDSTLDDSTDLDNHTTQAYMDIALDVMDAAHDLSRLQTLEKELTTH